MFRIWSLIKSVILWSYERGSWQYDIMVVVILAFVFVTPVTWFESSNRKQCGSGNAYIDATTLAKTESPKATIEELVSSYIRKSRSDDFRIERIEPKIDTNKRVLGYCVSVEPANQIK
jgi:hypothetical protein